MARKKRRSKTRNLGKDLLNNSVVKVILGLVATGSFAIAFGQEKIAQFIPFVGSNSTECLKQFYRDELSLYRSQQPGHVRGTPAERRS